MVITFYSYKGGVGRTQLLANTAVALANQGFSITMVDMDLESPGLHTYFSRADDMDSAERMTDQDLAESDGLIDLLTEHLNDGSSPPDVCARLIPVDHAARDRNGGSLHLLPPGRLDERYPGRVSSFPWDTYYAEHQGYAFMEYVRLALVSGTHSSPRPDFVLIDSRTGLTDIGSICTAQLPDLLVVLFALHAQGVDGAQRIARAVNAYREQEGDDARLRDLFLLPSRVEENGDRDERDRMLDYAAKQLQGLGDLLLELDDRLPYDPKIAYGEPVVVGAQDARPTYLSRAYERFADRLAKCSGPSGAADQTAGSDLLDVRAVPNRALKAREDLITDLGELRTCLERLQGAEFSDLQVAAGELGTVLMGARSAHDEVLDLIDRLCPDCDPTAKPSFPEQRSDVDAFETHVKESVELAVSIWIDNWIDKAKQHLRAEVGALDEVSMDQQLAELREAAGRESLADLRARLRSAESLLRRDSLHQLLRERRLGTELLERAIQDPTARRQWLEDQLTGLLEDGDPNEKDLESQLWNTLELLLSQPSNDVGRRPEPVQWNAYDLLCMLTSGQEQSLSPKERDCFVVIGAQLWTRDWQALLEGEEDLRLGWPCGLDARGQLARVAAAEIPEFDELVASVTQALSAGQRSHTTLLKLLDQRRDDPVIERMALSMGMDNRNSTNRGLLAKWLYIRAPEWPSDLLGSYLVGLAEEGYETEALIAACAFRQAYPEAGKGSWLPGLVARYVAALVERAQGSEPDEGLELHLEALLFQPSFMETLCRSRPGVATAALLGGFERGPQIGPESRRELALNLLHTHRSHGLPESVLEILRRVEHGDAPSADTVAALQALIEKVWQQMDITPWR